MLRLGRYYFLASNGHVQLPQKIDAMGFADRKYGSGRKRTACTSENIVNVEELVLSQVECTSTRNS